MRELRGRAWIDFAPGTELAATVEALSRQHHLRREVTAQVSQLDVLVELVRAGLASRSCLRSCREQPASSHSQ